MTVAKAVVKRASGSRSTKFSVVNFTETKISYEMLLTVDNDWMDWLQFSARIPACSQRMNPNYFKDALTLLMWPYHEVNICDI